MSFEFIAVVELSETENEWITSFKNNSDKLVSNDFMEWFQSTIALRAWRNRRMWLWPLTLMKLLLQKMGYIPILQNDQVSLEKHVGWIVLENKLRNDKRNEKTQVIEVLHMYMVLRTHLSPGTQLYAECTWLFTGFVLPVITLCPQINIIGRKQILEMWVLARFGWISLVKYLQQREADVQLPTCSTSTINSNFE